MSRMICLLALFCSLLVLSSCEEDPTDSDAQAWGTLRLSLMDAPAPIEGLSAMHIVIESVSVREAAESDEDAAAWHEMLPDSLSLEERTVDLLQYANGETFFIGEDLLPVGRYDEIRLVLESASVTIDAVVRELVVPSGETSGLKVKGVFDIVEDDETSMILDFDVGRSLFASPAGSDEYKLKPVIRLVSEAQVGRILGTVLPLGIDAMVMAVSVDLDDTVTAFVDTATGEYALGSLLPSVYDVTAMAPGYSDSTITGLAVERGQDSGPVDFELLPLAP